MAKKGNRGSVWMVPVDKTLSTFRFRAQRNKVNESEKLRIMKYDPTVRKHIEFVETK